MIKLTVAIQCEEYPYKQRTETPGTFQEGNITWIWSTQEGFLGQSSGIEAQPDEQRLTQ